MKIKRSSSSSKPNISKQGTNQNMTRGSRGVGVPPGSTLSGYCAAMMNSKSSSSSSLGDHQLLHHDHQKNCMGMKTLNLFPVHPTGILEHKFGGNSTNNSAANSCATSSSSDTNINDNGDCQHQQQHFFDFFSSESR
ncbi:hypothetical protein BVRB_7g174140 [Beta vulgaris subsp. vulgaris]|nr:hypothetical protein BVRB_7g174140 [Beta vulgaris subsp. vulgaris]